MEVWYSMIRQRRPNPERDPYRFPLLSFSIGPSFLYIRYLFVFLVCLLFLSYFILLSFLSPLLLYQGSLLYSTTLDLI